MQVNQFSGIQAGIQGSPNLSRMAAKPAGPVKFGFQSLNAAEQEGDEFKAHRGNGQVGPIAYKKKPAKQGDD